MIQKDILGVVFVSAFVLASNAYAGKVELTTFYPAPYGEYNKLQSGGSCVGTGCNPATDVADDKLKVKGDAEVTNDVTVGGKMRVGGSGTKGFVIQQGTPTNREDGQMWIP